MFFEMSQSERNGKKMNEVKQQGRTNSKYQNIKPVEESQNSTEIENVKRVK